MTTPRDAADIDPVWAYDVACDAYAKANRLYLCGDGKQECADKAYAAEEAMHAARKALVAALASPPAPVNRAGAVEVTEAELREKIRLYRHYLWIYHMDVMDAEDGLEGMCQAVASSKPEMERAELKLLESLLAASPPAVAVRAVTDAMVTQASDAESESWRRNDDDARARRPD